MKVLARAPGRVNLIGEHTDYNMGFVLPAALDQALSLYGRKTEGRVVTAYAAGLNASASFNLDQLEPVQGEPQWYDYIKAVFWSLRLEGFPLVGAEIELNSNIPIGAGLSSSAALEMAAGAAMVALAGRSISCDRLAIACWRAENEYIGVRCGIMDQFAVGLSRKDQALFLDCRSREYRHVPLNLGDYRLLIVDSRVNRSLAGSAYNRRRQECEEAVEVISKACGHQFNSLREINLETLNRVGNFLTDPLYRRSLYVIEENRRVESAVQSLERGDLEEFGALMLSSHAGLRDLYEVSCPELDLIVDSAVVIDGVAGARMTGAGFGGCAVALVNRRSIDRLEKEIARAFQDAGYRRPLFYLSTAGSGLSFETF